MVRDSERSLDNERMTLLEHARDSEGAAFDHVDGSLALLPGMGGCAGHFALCSHTIVFVC